MHYLHRELFRTDPPPELVSNYLRVHAEIPAFRLFEEGELRTVRTVVERRLDAVGIELWLRTRQNRRHALSAKLLLLSYLAECDARHNEFSRRSSGLCRAIARMCLAIITAAGSGLRGRFQIAWYGLR